MLASELLVLREEERVCIAYTPAQNIRSRNLMAAACVGFPIGGMRRTPSETPSGRSSMTCRYPGFLFWVQRLWMIRPGTVADFVVRLRSRG